eukprot:CAMPEP_0179079766 /NCGR_PEP_ID=MMETSP0796-20121207/35810_1 /TAXON_ID=73915 /ORGANISM="Pyrodinium bahamense, Strain pbaha01" /LENGTH=344 /DNA_ID=CAMNT_0020777109 /DNA_START=256 /DNA_END=1289 /DNA_ORIENTATION=-
MQIHPQLAEHTDGSLKMESRLSGAGRETVKEKGLWSHCWTPEASATQTLALEWVVLRGLRDILVAALRGLWATAFRRFRAAVFRDLWATALCHLCDPALRDTRVAALRNLSATALRDLHEPALRELRGPALHDFCGPTLRRLRAAALRNRGAPALRSIDVVEACALRRTDLRPARRASRKAVGRALHQPLLNALHVEGMPTRQLHDVGGGLLIEANGAPRGAAVVGVHARQVVHETLGQKAVQARDRPRPRQLLLRRPGSLDALPHDEMHGVLPELRHGRAPAIPRVVHGDSVHGEDAVAAAHLKCWVFSVPGLQNAPLAHATGDDAGAVSGEPQAERPPALSC